MGLVDLHVQTNRGATKLNPDLPSLAATDAKRTAASDLRPYATAAGYHKHIGSHKICRTITLTQRGIIFYINLCS